MVVPKNNRGFALPVILITCLALLVVILSSMQAASSIRSAIDDQYYGRLADEAAEAGATYAVSCLSQNSYEQSWITPLTQTTACDGTPFMPTKTITGQPNTATTFKVGDIEGDAAGPIIVSSTGTINRLADGTTTVVKTYTSTIKRIANDSSIRFNGITLGYYYDGLGPGAYYAIKGSDGVIRVAGANQYGQLATGGTANVPTPQPLVLPGGKKVQAAYSNFLAQGKNVYYLATDGTVYGAGRGEYGQLGNGSFTEVNQTPQVFGGIPSDETATYVGVLGTSTYVLTNKGNIYAAGQCVRGVLGVGNINCGAKNAIANPLKVQFPQAPDPGDPNTIPDRYIVGDYYTVYVKMKGGRVYGIGNNSEGQLCDNTTTNTYVPKKIGNFGDPGQPKASKIAFDGDTLYILDSNKKVWTCGDNTYGQLGLGNSAPGQVKTLTQVPIPGNADVTTMATDQWHVLFRTVDGDVYGAGYNTTGQLGNNRTANAEKQLVRFDLDPGVKAAYVYVSSLGNKAGEKYNDSFVVTTKGKVYGAGGNSDGQLGNGTNTAYETHPVAMDKFNGTTLKAKTVVTGFGATYVFTTRGAYYVVGNNQYGQLGTGDTTSLSSPVEAQYLKGGNGSFVF